MKKKHGGHPDLEKMAGCLELACCATAAEDLLKAQDGPATTKLWPLHVLWSFYCVFLRRFAVAYHLTLTGLFSCPTRVEAGPCCSDHGLQEAGELGAGREVAAFHSGHACEAHVDEFMARPLFDKVPLRAVFFDRVGCQLACWLPCESWLPACSVACQFFERAGCQLARWRASFLKELAASLLAGVPAFLQKLAASLLGGVPVFCNFFAKVGCQLARWRASSFEKAGCQLAP